MRILSTGLALGFALLMAASASADPLLDFTVPSNNPGAHVTYAGGSSALIGTGIGVTNVQGLATPSNDLVSSLISSGVLNFTTGADTPGTWNFGSGGSIAIWGKIPALGLTSNTLLMSGSFLDAQVIKGRVFRSTTLIIAGSAFLNTINPVLRTYYGLAGAIDWSGSFNVQVEAAGKLNVGDKITSSRVLSGDVATSPILPEPGTIVMAGLGGLLCLGVYGRRMFVRRAA